MKQPSEDSPQPRNGWPVVIVLSMMLFGLLCALYLVLNPCWSGEGCTRTISESERIVEITEPGLINPSSQLVQHDTDGKTPLYTRVDRADGTTVFSKYESGKLKNVLTLRPDTERGPRDVWPGPAEINRRGMVGETLYRNGAVSSVDEYYDNGKDVRKRKHFDANGGNAEFVFYQGGPAQIMFIDVLGDGSVRIENYFRSDGTRYQRATVSPEEFTEAFFDDKEKVTEQTFGKPKELAYTKIKYFEGGGPEQFHVTTNMESTQAREFDRSGGLLQERVLDKNALTTIRIYSDGTLRYEQVWKTADGEDRIQFLTEYDGDTKKETRFQRDGKTPLVVTVSKAGVTVQAQTFDDEGFLVLSTSNGITELIDPELEVTTTVNSEAVQMPEFGVDVPWPGQQG